MTRQEGIAKMEAFAARQPLPLLAASLKQLDAKPKLDDAERLTWSVLIDVICQRCPEAAAAFDAWAESDDTDAKTPIAAIVAAAKRSK
jgi:hypothetical protein